MAATNFTPIQLYFSTTASAVPVAANLAQGELAINITDGKLYYEDNAGAVQVIATKGAGTIGGSTTQIQYNNAGALAGNAAMVFNNSTNVTTLTTLNLTNVLGAIYGGTAQSTYTQGDVLYASASNTLAKLGIGTVNYILTSSGSVPQWSAPSSISVLTATNLDGGAAGSVPYQSGVATTTFLAIGAANRVMTSTGSAPQWVTSLTGLTGVSSSSITNTSLTSGRVVVSTTAGLQADDADLTFDGTTLSAGGLSTVGLSTLVKTVKIGDSSFNGVAVFAAATPAKLYMGTGTVTDVTSAISATNAIGAIASLGITPIAATNTSVTYTNASTLYIAGAPSAGTNVTLTNPYALYIAAGAAYFGGAVTVAGSLSLAGVTVTSLTDSGLTSGRVTYAGTGGLLQDSANLTFNGTTLTANTLNLTNALGTAYGGTGLTSFTSGGVVYASSTSALATGSALVFDGTNLSVGTTALSGGKFSTIANLSLVQGLVIRDSATTYANNNNFVLLQNSAGATAGGLTHPAVTSLGVWGNTDIRFLVTSGATLAMTLDNTGLGIGAATTGKFLAYQSNAIQNNQGAYGSSGTFQTGNGALTLGGGSNPRGIGVLINANRDVGTTLTYGNNFETFGLIAVANVGTGGGYGTTGVAGYAESDGGVYGLRADAKTTSVGGASIAVGLYVGSVTGSTTNYGVYVNDTTAVNYFGGSVGVGTSSPIGQIDVVGSYARFKENASGAEVYLRGYYASVGAAIQVVNSFPLLFLTSNTEAARFDTSQNLLVGDTVNATGSTSRFYVLGTTSVVASTFKSVRADYECSVLWSNTTTGNNIFATFGTEAALTTRGSISYNRAGGLTVYNTTSDYRAKDIFGAIADSGSVIDSVPVYMGKMHGATQERPMFLAHETPEYAHTGEKDAVNKDGKPVYQQMDASALIPVMWAEIQSLRARLKAANI